jgi:hypothetical protein
MLALHLQYRRVTTIRTRRLLHQPVRLDDRVIRLAVLCAGLLRLGHRQLR